MENKDIYKSSIKKNGRFINYHTTNKVRRTFKDFLLWKTGYYEDSSALIKCPRDFIYPFNENDFDNNDSWAVWVNHCTFLIHLQEKYILTDPIWNDSCSPVNFLGPKRRHMPGIEMNDLPYIDYVLISHNHYDHLDKKTVLELFKRFPEIVWIVPKGLKNWFKRLNIHHVRELNWWESIKFSSGVEIFSTPAQHYSGRSLLDTNRTLWSGYVVETQNKRLYFTGDTGYNDHDFKAIGSKWKSFDLSLIPIGTYIPREFMKPVHINPQEAVKIHQDVGSRFSIGMHWKTFHLSDELLDVPPYELFLALQNENLDPKKFVALEPGSYVNW